MNIYSSLHLWCWPSRLCIIHQALLHNPPPPPRIFSAITWYVETRQTERGENGNHHDSENGNWTNRCEQDTAVLVILHDTHIYIYNCYVVYSIYPWCILFFSSSRIGSSIYIIAVVAKLWVSRLDSCFDESFLRVSFPLLVHYWNNKCV